METKVKLSFFSNYREMTSFCNSEGITKDNIVHIDKGQGGVILIYQK